MSNQLDPNMPGLFAIMAETIAQERLDYTHPNDLKPGIMERYMEKCGKPTEHEKILKQPLEPVSSIGDASQTPIKPQNALLRYFEYSHLPQKLQEISKPICELALKMDEVLPEGSEKTAGLRKLLEAKDCFVRANLG
jgi:hypothetical protein